MGPTYALIRGAIERKQCLEAVYGGHRRQLCPHILGSTDGEARALFFQFAGGSSRGLAPGGDWRCLPLAGLSDVSLRDGPWRTRSHSQPQHCVQKVDVEVSP